MKKIAIIGSGLIGRAWAMVFARAGHTVLIWDKEGDAIAKATSLIGDGLRELEKAQLIEEAPSAIMKRITVASSIEEALESTDYVQENTVEDPIVKKNIFRTMDLHAPPHCILASSTSTIQASIFSNEIKGRHRCLVAHPVNPPHIVPIVEISPAPWTTSEVISQTYDLHDQIGQVPILVKKEITGFILNRLQAALLQEAWRLVEKDYVSVDDLDKTIRDGLGLRWAFMGPFETTDLNAPKGIKDYAARFGGPFHKMMKNVSYEPWSKTIIDKVESERRKIMPASEKAKREAWRDERLMALIAHKRTMERKKSS